MNMKLGVFFAAVAVTALPAVPALAHCRTIHHRVHHVAWRGPIRHYAVRSAGCGCVVHTAYRRTYYRTAYRHAYYPVVYRRPRVVEVDYIRPRPLPIYRPYPIDYAVPFYRPHLYRPHRFFYGARFDGPRFHRWGGGGFSDEHRGHGWGHWR
jgi:hypothetical protein